jgi:hypothetical protein
MFKNGVTFGQSVCVHEIVQFGLLISLWNGMFTSSLSAKFTVGPDQIDTLQEYVNIK